MSDTNLFEMRDSATQYNRFVMAFFTVPFLFSSDLQLVILLIPWLLNAVDI